MSYGTAYRIVALLFLVPLAGRAAPLNGTAGTSLATSTPSTTPVALVNAANVPADASAPSALRPDWKNQLAAPRQTSLVAPTLGSILGFGVVALGMFCANSSAVENAFSSKPDAGHKAAVVTGSGIMLGGAAIVSVSLVQLGKAL